jgi:DNA processing protein
MSDDKLQNKIKKLRVKVKIKKRIKKFEVQSNDLFSKERVIEDNSNDQKLSQEEFEMEIEAKEVLTLSYLTSIFNLNLERLFLILNTYSSLDEGIKDEFKILKYNNIWFQKDQKINSFSKASFEFNFQKYIENLDKNKIKVLTYFDEEYPGGLIELEKPPITLYYQGDLDLLKKSESLTVVGSRNINTYSKLLLEKILRPACKKGLIIFSGLATGVDKLAHEIALEEKSSTIGVVGSGLDDDSFYPYQNLKLKREIIEKGGLVLSEYSPGIKPGKFTFPQRNRILASLTKATWVVQAGAKSGSLITSTYAKTLNKKILTSPAQAFDPHFSGNIELLKSGSVLIENTNDILKLYGGFFIEENEEFFTPKAKANFNNLKEELIYKTLGVSPISGDFLAGKLNLSINEVNESLTMLELDSLVMNTGENMWVRV